MIAALLLGADVARAVDPTPGTITEYSIPVSTSHPSGIAVGPDGNVWFTEGHVSEIGRITPAGVITEFPLPNAGSDPIAIAAGRDGNLWFTEGNGNRIGRISPAGVIGEYPLPAGAGTPLGITAGPDGDLWFVESDGNKIGRITTAGVIREYSLPTAAALPRWIAAGPDGDLWFTEEAGNNVGRITTSGGIREYPLPTGGSEPEGIVAGPDGNMWFTEQTGNRVGRITTSGAIREYPLPTAGSGPYGIAAGPDSSLWFTETVGNRVGRITTSGAISEYALPTDPGYPLLIAAGPHGKLWFTVSRGNDIGALAGAPSTAGNAGSYHFACSDCGSIPPPPMLAGCGKPSAGKKVCPSRLSFFSPDFMLKGAVTEMSGPVGGLTGSMSAACSARGSEQDHVTAMTRSKTYLLGESQDCSFHLAFSDGSTLDGSLVGASHERRSAVRDVRHVTAQMTVVSGSGELAGLVGSISFSREIDRAATGNTKPPPETWNLNLHDGAAGAAIVSPGWSLTPKTDDGLLAVTAAGARCTGLASSGDKRIELGRARADANGVARITRRLVPLLHRGTWTISVRCAAAVAHATVAVG